MWHQACGLYTRPLVIEERQFQSGLLVIGLSGNLQKIRKKGRLTDRDFDTEEIAIVMLKSYIFSWSLSEKLNATLHTIDRAVSTIEVKADNAEISVIRKIVKISVNTLKNRHC